MHFWRTKQALYAVSSIEVKVTTGYTVVEQEITDLGLAVRQWFSGSAGFGFDVELDVLTLDLRHLHVRGVLLALGSGELAVEFDPDRRVHP